MSLIFNYGNLSYTIQLWMIENVVSALNMTDKISLSTGFSIICNQIRGNKHVLIIVNKRWNYLERKSVVTYNAYIRIFGSCTSFEEK